LGSKGTSARQTRRCTAQAAFREASAILCPKLSLESRTDVLRGVVDALAALAIGAPGRSLALTPLEELDRCERARIDRFRQLAIQLISTGLSRAGRGRHSAFLLARACVHDADRLARTVRTLSAERARRVVEDVYRSRLGIRSVAGGLRSLGTRDLQ
jgi:hypothetical protein